MKTMTVIFFLFSVQLFSTCIFPESNSSYESEIKTDTFAGYLADLDSASRIDYSLLNISRDSLDIQLYHLIESPGNMPQDLLIKNIGNLLQRGANPNAMLQITYSVRKVGTYLPIIKHFYRDKYNEYTTATTSIHAAVGSRNVAVLEKLIEHGGKTDIQNQDKVYPIDIALKNNQIEMIDCLLKHGCNVQYANLAMSENVALIERFVKLGANVNTIDINFALENRSDLIRLLDLKPPLDKIELDAEVILNDLGLLDLLLSKGMSPEATGKFPDRCPLLFSAIKYGNREAFRKLINNGANIHATCRHGFGETPLQIAIHYKQIDLALDLLNLKASPNERDWTGKSNLILACGTDNDVIINLLLDRGADIEYAGYFGGTPLMFAAQYGHYIAAETLIKRKANVNFKSIYGETPLIKAIANNDYPMIKLLVENGANPKIKYEGKDLANYAKDKDAAPAIVDYLSKLIQK
jgi:ankyrin repeat protein